MKSGVRWLSVTLACLGGGLAATQPLTAQDDRMWRPPAQPEAIIYRDAGYSGSALNVSSDNPDMGLAWRVNSIRVKSGTWQLCERTRYRGQCRTFTADTPRIGRYAGMVVQSLRPVGSGGGGSIPGPLEPGGNPSLRGMAAQFYPAPAQNGYRVLACGYGNATANCVQQTARNFCSNMGWRTSARQAMETVRGRTYLADVLCSNTGY
jgi:hypothetical protein